MKKLFMAILGSVLLAGASAHATNYGVRVECWSDSGCAGTTLGDVCTSAMGTGAVPVSISCSQVKTPTTTTPCGSATCSYNSKSMQNASSYVGDFCQDVNGYDAIVTCFTNN